MDEHHLTGWFCGCCCASCQRLVTRYSRFLFFSWPAFLV